MKRQKMYERDFRTVEEREDIARKSDNLCCHCGQMKFVHYGATVDHFIPLDKGGCDRFINCIMLCEKCNEEKGNKVVDMSYIPYLKPKYKKELQAYFESYLHTMEYVERNRLFALDEYPIHVESICPTDFHRKKQNRRMITKKYLFKKATFDDLDKIVTYYIKYLKKVNSLDDLDAARDNIVFWLTFGCIYYLESNGEISLITVFTIKHVRDEEAYHDITNILQMYIFSYYCSDIAITLVTKLIYELPNKFKEEQQLDFLPYTVKMITVDPMVNYVYNYLSDATTKKTVLWNGDITGFLESYLYVGDDTVTDKQSEKVKRFLDQFNEVTNHLVKFFTMYPNRVAIGWMIYDLMSFQYIEETPLKDILFDEKNNLKTLDVIRKEEENQ